MFAATIAKAQMKAAASSVSKLAPQRSTLLARPFGGDGVEQAHMLQQGIVRLTCRDQKSPKQERSLRCRDCIPPFARRRGSESSQR